MTEENGRHGDKQKAVPRAAVAYGWQLKILERYAPNWSKMGLFQENIVLSNSNTTQLLNRYVFTNFKSFQMRYCMSFYLKSIASEMPEVKLLAVQIYLIK